MYLCFFCNAHILTAFPIFDFIQYAIDHDRCADKRRKGEFPVLPARRSGCRAPESRIFLRFEGGRRPGTNNRQFRSAYFADGQAALPCPELRSSRNRCLPPLGANGCAVPQKASAEAFPADAPDDASLQAFPLLPCLPGFFFFSSFQKTVIKKNLHKIGFFFFGCFFFFF